MGCNIELKHNISSEITKSPFNNLEEIEIPDDFTNNARFPIIKQASNILHEKYDDKIPFIATIMGPFTLLCQILSTGPEELIKQLNKDIVGIEDSLYTLTTAIFEEIDFYKELNIDIISIFEPYSSPSLLKPKFFQQNLQPFLEEISNKIYCPSLLHICGDTTPILKNMLTSGFEGVIISDNVDISNAKQLQAELNTKTRICGNVSTAKTLFMKNEKEVYDETMKILSNGIDILSPGCMISPNTPLNNLKKIIKARNDFCNLSNEKSYDN